jgi:hypothetical protein
MKENVDHIPSGPSQGASRAGPFLAKIVSHLDPTFMGMLEVEILRPVGNDPKSEGQLHQVKLMTPFYGTTNVDYVGNQDDYNNTQKSYGMWFIPPDVGTTVMVIFIDGDPKRGYWIGCVPDEAINFMVPGIAATEFAIGGGGRMPVAEYNKKVNDVVSDPTKVKKPVHPFAEMLKKQGLLKDDIRGITTSSARREVPSAVFGISTPGPVDKRSGAKTGKVGKKEHQIPNAFVSRLGGATFVMDDGDDKFLRKTPASSGPPTYMSVEQGQTGGDLTIPHNELLRLRTRTGHQILLHNSEDLIYIGNASGTTWIELTSNGKIDIFAKDSISIHTENDFNVTANRDINFKANGNINFTAMSNFNVTANVNYEIKAEKDGKLTVGGTSHINAGGNHIETAAKIHMNGPAAAKAVVAHIPNRIPQHEPWSEHENLDPANFTKEKTVAVAPGTKPLPTPAAFNTYTTTTDTFSKVKGGK